MMNIGLFALLSVESLSPFAMVLGFVFVRILGWREIGWLIARCAAIALAVAAIGLVLASSERFRG